MQCGFCKDSNRFKLETSDAHVSNANFKYNFFVCTKCDAVVGVSEHFHTPTLLAKIAKHLGLDLYA